MGTISCRFSSQKEVKEMIDTVVSALEANGVKEAEKRTGRNVAHAMLLCAHPNRLKLFKDKREELTSVVFNN